MMGAMLISFAVWVTPQQATPTTAQVSTGWCSPNIAYVTGNVTVKCIGVDPRALFRLNAQLDHKQLQLAEKIREANDWTTRYKELEARLRKAGDNNALSRQAEEYLHQGELEKAGAILDQILGSEDKQTDHTAADHYNRALVFELQFDPVAALSHLKKAYLLATANENGLEEVTYGREYGKLLLDQKEYVGAEPVLIAALVRARELAKANPTTY